MNSSNCSIKGKDKKALIILEGKLKQLYETIRDHKDAKSGRQVSSIFMKLPSKSVSNKLKIILRNSEILSQIRLEIKIHSTISRNFCVSPCS